MNRKIQFKRNTTGTSTKKIKFTRKPPSLKKKKDLKKIFTNQKRYA